MGYDAKPEDFGWQCKQNSLNPITITKVQAPEVLLKTLFCNCKTNCAACKKSGLPCTEACNCNSTSCLNSPPLEDIGEEEDEFINDLEMEWNMKWNIPY